MFHVIGSLCQYPVLHHTRSAVRSGESAKFKGTEVTKVSGTNSYFLPPSCDGRATSVVSDLPFEVAHRQNSKESLSRDGEFRNWATRALYCAWNSHVPAQRVAMRRGGTLMFD